METQTFDLGQLMPLLAPVIAAMVTQLVKAVVPQIPKVLLPILSTALGATTAAFGFQVGPQDALALGLAGTGVAEGTKQIARVATQHPARLRAVLLLLTGCTFLAPI